jgi:hypothetical protein
MVIYWLHDGSENRMFGKNFSSNLGGKFERSCLQVTILILGLLPVLSGLTGMINGAAFVEESHEASLDSHVRYLSGLLFGIGSGFWSIIPRIEFKGARCRLLTAIVFVGGLARLGGIVFYKMPSMPMMLACGMELIVTPLICLWQMRVAQNHMFDN